MDTLNPIEMRLIGVLIEKEATTPEQYPLTINALTLGANQKTNRSPVSNYNETEVANACESMQYRSLIVRHQVAGSRANKYHHLIQDRFSCTLHKLHILASFFLKGDLTPGEVLSKCKRACPELTMEALLEELEEDQKSDEPWFRRLERQPGQKEARWSQNWCNDEADENASVEYTGDDMPSNESGLAAENTLSEPSINQPYTGNETKKVPLVAELQEEVLNLKDEVQFLRDEVQELREILDEMTK
ncbi:MAG: DUF480 domain-containing protein [Planctomycetes bacterium]|nr:DUF480 domain-containing protein [Planctomycetota bacterium]